MESHNNLDIIESVPLATTSSEALAIAKAADENEAAEDPPQKRSRSTEETQKPTTSEATSSTSPSKASDVTLVVPVEVIETAEATPVKQETPPRTSGKKTKSLAQASSSTTTCLGLAATSTLRTFRKIPVFVVDYHNDVLEFLYRCLASRHLPLENNILVHFDSHPDMVINQSLPASASYDKEVMLENLSIESWIMPSVFTGHFNRIVWMKNSWCQQIPVGKHMIKVGQKDDKLCVDSPLDYFIAEGNFCPVSEMKQSRGLELQVFDADTDDVWPHFITAADAHNFVLDIDLDFFSTLNPFLDIYTLANCYERLTKIFHYEKLPTDCNLASERRQQQLRELRIIFENLETTGGLQTLPSSVFKVIPLSVIDQIELLREALHEHYPDHEINWILIYDAGCTTDSHGLPHHVSTEEELEQYFTNLTTFLERLTVPPVAVTIACSAEDEYCPKFQVEEIEERVLQLLGHVFGDRMHETPILQYMCDEWNVMQL